MPRYFQSLTATGRPVIVGDRSFVFEPVEPMGGSWLGVLAVDDESAASHLAANGIDEISAERFEALKKKLPGPARAQGFVPSPMPQPPSPPLAAESAGPAGAPTDRKVDSATAASGAKPLVSVILRTTDQVPPAEALFEEKTAPRRKAA